MYQSEEAKKQMQKDAARCDEIKIEIQALRNEEHAILDTYLGFDEGQWHKIAEWECNDSPVGRCVYNPYINFGRGIDSCIYCHQPIERK